MALAPELKTRQIRKFGRKCRDRVNQLAALTSASAGIPARLYDLNSDGGHYRIDYAGPGQWTVEVVRAPPKNRAGKKPAAKKAAGNKAASMAAPKRPKSAPAVGAAQPSQRRLAAPDKPAAKHLPSPGPVSDPTDKA